MSTLRMIREVTMLLAVGGGAIIGYTAGGNYDATTRMIFSFVGMSVFGAFADFCIRGNK